MSPRPFLDTNILVYSVAQGDPRAEVAEALLAAGAVIGVQGLNEFVSVARRKLGMGWDAVEQALASFRTLCPDPVTVTTELHEQALILARQNQLNIYDALMLAAALRAGCSVLYSEDMQDGLKIGKQLTVLNPFAAIMPGKPRRRQPE